MIINVGGRNGWLLALLLIAVAFCDTIVQTGEQKDAQATQIQIGNKPGTTLTTIKNNGNCQEKIGGKEINMPLPIVGCVKMNPANTGCERCSPTLALTDEGSACVAPYEPHPKVRNPESCNAEEYLNSVGKCQSLWPNCINYSSCGECLKCAPGTENINGRCRPYPIFSLCEEFNGKPTGGKCQKCVRSAVPDNTTTTGCRQIQVACSRFAASGECESCNGGYSMAYFSCVKESPLIYSRKDMGCHTWTAGICAVCVSGFTLGSNGICDGGKPEGTKNKPSEGTVLGHPVPETVTNIPKESIARLDSAADAKNFLPNLSNDPRGILNPQSSKPIVTTGALSDILTYGPTKPYNQQILFPTEKVQIRSAPAPTVQFSQRSGK